MRKHLLLITVATTALLAGASIGSAQRVDQPGGSGKSAPAQTQKSPDAAPVTPGTTGQSPAEPRAKETPRPEAPKSGTAPKPGTSGQAPAEKSEPRAKDTPKSGKADKADPKDTPKSTTAPKSGTTGQTPEKKTDGPAQKSTQPSGQTPGARTDATASLTVEQRTRIRETVLKGSNVPRVGRVDFQINVGVVVPRTVRVVALPGPVVEIHPAWRGFLYFVHGDEIVVVEPGTMRIVAVLPA